MNLVPLRFAIGMVEGWNDEFEGIPSFYVNRLYRSLKNNFYFGYRNSETLNSACPAA
jgi:hypothetical protein